MDREPNGATGVGHAPGDGLADPPGGVRRELEPFAPVELVHRVDQTQVAFLHQIEQRQVGGLISLGDGHHQAQVGLDECLGGLVSLPGQAAQLPLSRRGYPLGRGELGPGFPARFDGLGQAGFVVLGEQGMPPMSFR